MAMPRKRPLVDPKQYYAYVWRLDGRVLWVGQGKDNRGRPTAKACWNGRPEALKEILRTRATDIEVEVRPCSSQDESVDLERKLIADLSPEFNTAPQRGGWKGMHSPEALKRMSEGAKKRTMSKAFREAARARMMGNQLCKGRKPWNSSSGTSTTPSTD